MILYIDTSQFGKVYFCLTDNKNIIKGKTFSIKPQDTHKILEFLDKFLKQSKINKFEITKLFVCKGPGSFTGIRVGLSLAQAISLAQDIPLKILDKEKFKKEIRKKK